MAADNVRMVKLESSDGKEFEVPYDVAKMSATVSSMLEGRGWHSCCISAARCDQSHLDIVWHD